MTLSKIQGPGLVNLLIGTTKLADGVVTNAKLADTSVSTSKLQDTSVTVAKLADLSVSTAKLQDNSVSFFKISSSIFATAAELLAGTASKLVSAAGLNSVLFGAGQTWQSVTRNSGTTYTNSTNKPITIHVFAPGVAAGSTTVDISVNGGTNIRMAAAFSSSGSPTATGLFIVQPGATYVFTDINVSGAKQVFELR